MKKAKRRDIAVPAFRSYERRGGLGPVARLDRPQAGERRRVGARGDRRERGLGFRRLAGAEVGEPEAQLSVILILHALADAALDGFHRLVVLAVAGIGLAELDVGIAGLL